MADFRMTTDGRSSLVRAFGWVLLVTASLAGCAKTAVVPPRPPFPLLSRWEKPLELPLASALVSDGTLVFSILTDGSSRGIDPQTGEPVWTRAGSTPGLLATRAGTVILAEKGGIVWGLNPQDGSAQWKVTTHVSDVQSIRLDGNRVFIGGASGLAALIATTGELRYDIEANDVRDLDAAGEAIVAIESGVLVVRERETGSVRYTLESPEKQFGAPAIFADGRVVLGSGSRLVRQVSKSGHFGWRFKVGATVKHRPLDFQDRKRVGVISFEGVFYELSLGGGDMRRRVLLASRPFGPPVLVDGRIWVPIFEDDTSVIDAKTTKLIGRTRYGGSFLSAPVLVGDRLVAEISGPRRLVGLQTAPRH